MRAEYEPLAFGKLDKIVLTLFMLSAVSYILFMGVILVMYIVSGTSIFL